MGYRKHDIRKAIRQFDLFQYLEDHGVEFKVRSEGGYYYTDCFSCRLPKMFIHASEEDNYKGFFRCWVCGEKGDVFDIVSALDHISRRDAFIKIVGGVNEDFTNSEPVLKSELGRFIDKSKIKINAPVVLPSNFRPLIKFGTNCPGYRYALYRGITPELMEKFDLRYNAIMKRIIFVIRHRGEIIGWQARAISSEMTPKMLSNQGFKKTHALYNFDNVCDKESATIVEGPIDVIKSHHHNPVALLGKSMSAHQFKLLLRMPHLKKLYVALDPDAIKVANDLAQKLHEIWDVNIVKTPRNRDFGDCDKEEVNYYIKTSKPYMGKGELCI